MSNYRNVEGERDYVFDMDSGMIHVRFYSEGKRIRRSTGIRGSIPPTSQDMKKAIHEGRKIVSNFDREAENNKISTKKAILVSVWFEKWLDRQQILVTPGHYQDMNSRWKNYLKPFFGDFDVRDINESSWDDYAIQFKRKNPGKLLKHHKIYLRAFLGYMHQMRDPVTKERFLPIIPELKNFDPARDTPGRAITHDEEKAILAAAEKPTHRLQILMGIKMGMRQGEILQLQKDFIKWDIEEIQLPASYHKTGRKTRKARNIPIHPEVLALLKEVADANDTPFLFPSPINRGKPLTKGGNQTAWEIIKKKAGITVRMRRHDMRVTRATRNAELGVPKALTQEILGMTPEVLDAHYTKLEARSRRRIYDYELNSNTEKKEEKNDDRPEKQD